MMTYEIYNYLTWTSYDESLSLEFWT
jgi:hypothetical protein